MRVRTQKHEIYKRWARTHLLEDDIEAQEVVAARLGVGRAAEVVREKHALLRYNLVAALDAPRRQQGVHEGG